MKKDKLLIICTEGAAYRDIVNSGVLEELYNKREIILVCADWMIPFLKDKFRKIQFEKVYESGKGESFIDHIRMTRAIYAPSAYPDVKTTSLKIKRDRDIKKTPFRFYSRRLIAIVSKPKFMQSILRSVSWIYRKNQIRDLFIKNNITAVFSTNMLTLDHLPYMEYAIKKGIPTATFIRSWDNLTSKGVPMYTPNKFLVWSPKETEECVKLHHISKKLVQEVGAPQFDPYFQNKIPSKEELFHRLKLPQHSRIIAYIGGIPQNVMGLTAENEKVIVDTILKGIDQGKLPNDAMVVIRPHPGVKDWKQYENFEKHKNVRINYPDWYLKGKDPPKSWNPNWDDHLFMGSLMKYSSVVVTPFQIAFLILG